MSYAVELEMERRKTRFYKAVEAIQPEEAEEIAALLEQAIAKSFAFASVDFRKSVIPAEWHYGIREDEPASFSCHAPNEAMFNIMGGYCMGLRRHLYPMKHVYPVNERINPEMKENHRFLVSAYSGRLYDTSRAQLEDGELEKCAQDAERQNFSPQNGWPSEKGRKVIHWLNDVLQDPTKGEQCYGAKAYHTYQQKLQPLAEAAADYWPTKEQQMQLGINRFNRTPRQQKLHSESPVAMERAEKARLSRATCR